MKIILSEIGIGGVEADERSFDVGVIRIGRTVGECEIAFDSAQYPMVSRKHAELRWNDGKWFVVDLNSSYGTFLDEVRVSAPTRLRAGQTIRFGEDGPLMRVVWFEVLIESLPPEAPRPEADKKPVQPVPAPIVNPFDLPKTPIEAKPVPSVPAAAPPPAQISAARLEFVDDPARPALDLGSSAISIGREPSCDIPFPADKIMVSRKHALIRLEGGKFILEDNGSFNGTYINDQRIAAAVPLYHDDRIQLGIGGPMLRFHSPSRIAPEGSSLAGQRSISVSNAGGDFVSPEAIKSKTMVFRVDKSPASMKSTGSVDAQLMMSLAFGDIKELTIGRSEANDITLDGLQISGRHARILRSGSDIVIDDLGSTNGVFVNGVRISRQSITPSDKVQIGSFELRIDSAGNIGVFDTRSKTRIDAVNITKEVRAKGGRLRLLDEISLTIEPNEFVGFLGPSGAGKSMLMDALNGMRPASSGSVLINNLDLYQHLDSLKQAIGYVPQDDIIHRELTVYRTLYYVAKLRLSRDVSSAEIDQTIDEVLDVTGLADRRDVPVNQLSGGQRKRVSIAVELVTKPSIIFLDEPTSGLDPGTEEKIMKLFRQIAESGRTVILTTHAMENVKLFDKVVVLMRGRLVFYGPPQDVLKHLGASSFKELFDKLEEPVTAGVRQHGEHVRRELTDRTADEWKAKFAATPQYLQYVAAPQRSLGAVASGGIGKRSRLGLFGSIRQWITLSRRYFEVLLKDKLNLFILFAQAPVIAMLTFLVLGENLPRDLAYFVIALVAVWFGTSVAAREIIRERPVYIRERMVNLGLIPYLLSKLLVLAIIVSIQCLTLFVPLKLFDITGLMPMPGDLGGIPQFWTMLVTGAVGIAIGLLISAIVKTSEMATSLVPLILIPQILLSGIFGVPGGISRPASMIVPAAWSFDTMKRFSTLDTLEPEGADLRGMTGGQGLYKQIETDNDKIIADSRKNLEDYKKSSESKLKDLEDQLRLGWQPSIPKFDEPPAIPPAKKLPKNLSNYVTFLHPWMNEIVNQIVLMLMFGMLVIATLIVLRLKDIR